MHDAAAKGGLDVGASARPWDAMRRYRRAADYLAAAMIFLRDNVLV